MGTPRLARVIAEGGRLWCFPFQNPLLIPSHSLKPSACGQTSDKTLVRGWCRRRSCSHSWERSHASLMDVWGFPPSLKLHLPDSHEHFPL